MTDIINKVAFYLVSPVENIVILYFLYKMFGAKIPRKYLAGPVLSFIAICGGVNGLCMYNPIAVAVGPLIATVLYSGFTLCFYKGSVRIKLLLCFFIMSNVINFTEIGYLITKLITGDSMQTIMDYTSEYTAIIFVVSRSALIIYLALVRRAYNTAKMATDDNKWSMPWVYVISTACNVGIFFILYDLPKKFTSHLTIMVIALSSSGMVLYVLHSTKRTYLKNKRIQDLEIQNVKNLSVQMSLEHIVNSETALAKVNHDHKNHMITMSTLANGNDFDGLKSYLNGIVDNYAPLSDRQICKDKYLNAALVHKLDQCHNNGIDIRYLISGQLPEKESISCCILLFNLIDNAITGVEKCQEKRITVEVKALKSCVIGSVSNTITDSVLKNNPMLHTTKKAPGHGLGHQIVEKVTNHYDGELYYSEKEGEFIVDFKINYRCKKDPA